MDTPRVLATVAKRRQHHLARSTCAAASNVRSSPLGADMVCKARSSFADELFTQGLMALTCVDAADHLLREGAVCTRVCDRVVTVFSGGATPTDAVWLRARALSSRAKLISASPIVAS